MQTFNITFRGVSQCRLSDVLSNPIGLKRMNISGMVHFIRAVFSISVQRKIICSRANVEISALAVGCHWRKGAKNHLKLEFYDTYEKFHSINFYYNAHSRL